MSMEFGECVAIVAARMRAQSVLLQHMVEVKRRYNCEWLLPMPNMDEEPTVPNYGPSLIADAVEHLAIKAGSVHPGIIVPALRPDKLDGGPGSPAWANIRRRALQGTWARNQMPLGIRTFYKHMVGYATGCLMWMPDFEPRSRTYRMPKLVVRDPLQVFPEPKPAYDMTPPRNLGTVSAQSTEAIIGQWGERRPDVVTMLRSGRNGGIGMWDLLEWVDDEVIILGIMGPHLEGGYRQEIRTGGYGQNQTGLGTGQMTELTRWENKAGMVPAVCPQQVTMDKVASAVAKNVGQSDLQAKLMALDIMATEKSILPDRYVIGKRGQAPSVVGGRWKDGRTGETNIILDADSIGLLHQDVSPQGRAAIDRAERNLRVSTGLTPSWGAESYGQMRTGRGMDALAEASTDPRLMELQEQGEFALTELNRGAIAMFKGYWPQRRYTFFSGVQGDAGQVTFVPKTHLESDEQAVKYPILGTDSQTLTIRLAQLLGAKAMSLRTFRQKHPDIPDDMGEERQVWIEQLEQVAIDSLAALVQDKTMPPEDLAQVGQYIQQNNDVFGALKLAGDLAQRRQASQAPSPEETGETGPNGEALAVAPGTQPGLGAPGAGMEQQPPGQTTPIAPPPLSLDNLRSAVRDLRVSSPVG